MEKGIICAGSSDAPVETANPLQGIFDAMTRFSEGDVAFLTGDLASLSFEDFLSRYNRLEERSLDEEGEEETPLPSPIFNRKERLSFAEALYCYTFGSSISTLLSLF